MTLPVQAVRYVYQGPYNIGDTVPIPFDYMEGDHVDLYKNKEQLRYNIDYTVLGGNATLNIAVSSTDKIVVVRDTPANNDAEFPQEASFDSEKINDAIDKIVMKLQELEEELDRAIKTDIDAPTGTIIGLPTPDPSKCLKWDTSGENLINSLYDPDSQVANASYWAQQAENAANRAAGYLQQIQELIANFEDQMDSRIEEIVNDKISTSLNGTKILPITQAEYQNLVDTSTTDADTLYVIKDA